MENKGELVLYHPVHKQEFCQVDLGEVKLRGKDKDEFWGFFKNDAKEVLPVISVLLSMSPRIIMLLLSNRSTPLHCPWWFGRAHQGDAVIRVAALLLFTECSASQNTTFLLPFT